MDEVGPITPGARKEARAFLKWITSQPPVLGTDTVAVGIKRYQYLCRLEREFKKASRDGRIDAFTHDAIVNDLKHNLRLRPKPPAPSALQAKVEAHPCERIQCPGQMVPISIIRRCVRCGSIATDAIAHARTALPAALTELALARAVVETGKNARAELDRLCDIVNEQDQESILPILHTLDTALAAWESAT